MRIQIALHRIRGNIPDLEKSMSVMGGSPKRSHSARVVGSNIAVGVHEYQNKKIHRSSDSTFGVTPVVQRPRQSEQEQKEDFKTKVRNFESTTTSRSRCLYKSHDDNAAVAVRAPRAEQKTPVSMFGAGFAVTAAANRLAAVHRSIQNETKTVEGENKIGRKLFNDEDDEMVGGSAMTGG